MATSSFVAMTGIIDAIIVGLIEETDFSIDQFALIHPGGAVGKRINI